MLDHVSITVSDMHRAERFYDAIMKALNVVKVGSRMIDSSLKTKLQNLKVSLSGQGT